MNAWHFALNTWIMLIPNLTRNQEIRVFLMKKPMVLMFLGMELILHLRLNMYMMKVALIKCSDF
jgi:hypothetical protein